MPRFEVWSDPEAWPFRWFWRRLPLTGPVVTAHGAYPFRWCAWLAAWAATRRGAR